jgi:SAM-dependent methyltransferase
VAEPNETQRDLWNGDSGIRWVADADRRDVVLRPALDALLSAAALCPGERVLDIGCGCGATTMAAAHQVVPAAALGVDISEPMLDLARRRARPVPNTFFVQADVQTHPFEQDFDVVISRFGTMFFDDPTKAFANIASAVRPDGRLCLATWQPLEANAWLMVPGLALLRHGSLPEADAGPGMFSQSDPDQVTAVISGAGWGDVEVTPITVALHLGADPAEATDYLADTGVARRVLDTIPEDRRARALEDVTATLAEHSGVDGVVLDAGLNLITARR